MLGQFALEKLTILANLGNLDENHINGKRRYYRTLKI